MQRQHLEETPKIWMVYGVGQGMPTRLYDDIVKAADEAKRLARDNRGVRFIVMEAAGVFVCEDVRCISLRENFEDDTIPF